MLVGRVCRQLLDGGWIGSNFNCCWQSTQATPARMVEGRGQLSFNYGFCTTAVLGSRQYLTAASGAGNTLRGTRGLKTLVNFNYAEVSSSLLEF